MVRWLGVFLVAFLTAGQVEAQAPPDLIVDEPQLIISGWHGAGGTYSGSVRLTAKTEQSRKPSFLSSDLTREKDGMKIDRQKVTTDGEIQLSLNTPKNIKINVTGIEEPGTYKGKIEFRPQGADSGKTLDLFLFAKVAQPLTPLSGTDQIKLHLTYGTWSKILPKAETIDQRVLQFKNSFQLPVKLLKADFLLLGDQTGYKLMPPSVEVKANNTQAPDSVANFTLTLNRKEIPPDKYTGSILLWFEGAKEALQLPVVELTMRNGPLKAFLILVVGIFLGQFLLYMKTKGLPLAEILNDLDNLKNQITKLGIGDQKILETMLEKVEWQVSQNKLEDAKDALGKINYRLFLLNALEAIEGSLQKPSDNVLEIIKSIRVYVIRENDTEATNSFNKLKEIVLTLNQPAVTNLIMVIEEQEKARKTLPAPLSFKKDYKKLEYWKQSFRNIYPFLLKRLGPPIYYIITSLILVVVGLVTLYLKNMTFGASPLVDYFVLITWGLGTDVASRNVAKVLDSTKLSSK